MRTAPEAAHGGSPTSRGAELTSAWAPALLTLAGLALALRIYRLGYQSLWMDEVLSATNAGHSLAQLLTQPGLDANFPPLHNVVLHLVRRWLGTGDALLRLPSAIAGALSVPALFAAARPAVGARAALFGAFLLAISPFHLWYGQEARPYALLVLFGLLAAWCAQRFIERPTSLPWLAGFVLAAAATFYCHVIAGPILLALGAFILAKVGPAGRARALGGILVLGLLLVPQVLRFVSAPPTVSARPGYQPELAHIGYTLWAFGTGYSLGPSVLELRGGRAGVEPYLWLVLPVLGWLLALAALGSWFLWRRRRNGFWFLAGWVTVPIASAMLGAIVTVHPYNVRYAILAGPGFLVLCAVGILALGSPWRRALAAVVVVGVQAAALVNYYAVPKYHREDNRSATRYLNANAAPGELVLASAGYTAVPLRYYGLRADLELVPYPKTGIVTPREVSRDLAPLFESRQRVWVFLSRTFHSDPDGEIMRYLESRLTLAREFAAPGVQVLLFARLDSQERALALPPHPHRNQRRSAQQE